MADAKSIELSIEDALALVQNILPALEAIPAIAPEAELASLVASGAQLVIPILFKLGNDLASKGVITTELQTEQLARLQKVLDFTGSEWKPSDAPQSTDAVAKSPTDSGVVPPGSP